MKKFTSIVFSGITVLLVLLSSVAWAQNESDLSLFLKATKQDANTLISGYVAPVIKGESYAATSGWYTTAKAHKTLGVDFSVSLIAAFTPTSDNYFQPQLSTSTKFQNLTNPSAGQPTFMGPKDKTQYTTTVNGVSGTFNGPEGLNLKHTIGFSAVPAAMFQLGIGIIKNTDLKIRYLPTVKAGDSKVSMFGLGVMHDVKQYLPGSDFLPFDLSVLFGFNKIKGTTSLINNDLTTSKPQSKDGLLSYKLNSWVAQAIISKKVAFLTGYLGVGYGSVNTNADITGTFTYNVSGQPISLKDPYASNFKAKSGKITAGLRMKFGPIFFVGDYTLQKYNALTLGFGFSIR